MPVWDDLGVCVLQKLELSAFLAGMQLSLPGGSSRCLDSLVGAGAFGCDWAIESHSGNYH